MKPSSLRMREISILSFDAGTSTLGWRASCALRMRVSMSATGSDVAIFTPVILSLPARLGHAGNFAGERKLPETNPAQVELAKESARTSAAEAAVAVAACVLLFADRLPVYRFLIPRDFRGSCHSVPRSSLFVISSSLLPERHAELA